MVQQREQKPRGTFTNSLQVNTLVDGAKVLKPGPQFARNVWAIIRDRRDEPPDPIIPTSAQTNE